MHTYQAKQKKGRKEVKVDAILISGIDGDSWFPSRNSTEKGKCKQHSVLTVGRVA